MDLKQNHEAKSEDISIKELAKIFSDWWKYLSSKWLIIFSIVILGSILGFYYAYTKKYIYNATTTFVLEDEKQGGSFGSLAGLASVAGVDLGSNGGMFQGDNIIELYKSKKIVIRTLLTKANKSQELLIERYLDFSGLKKSWSSKPELLKINFRGINYQEANFKPNRLRDSILTLVATDIVTNYLTVIKPDKKLSIIQVDVKATDEIFAKTFNEEIVKNVNNFYLQTKTKKSLKNIRILQEKTDSVRAVMNGAIYQAVAVTDATPNLNPTRQIQRIAPSQKAQFSAETNKAILSSLLQNLEITKLTLMKETPLVEVIDQPVYPLSRQKFGKLKGIIIGGFFGGFLTVIFMIIRRSFKKLMA